METIHPGESPKPDYAALCAELAHELDAETGYTRSDGRRIVNPAVVRARAALAEPEPDGPTPAGPSDDELDELFTDIDQSGEPESWRAFARAVLARWGRPAPQPVPVSERLPGPGDCTTNPRTGEGQWCWGWVEHDPTPYSGRWRMMRREWLVDEARAWLPAHALPLPS